MPVSMGYQQAHVVVYLWLSGLLLSNLKAATCSVLLCWALCWPAPPAVSTRPSYVRYKPHGRTVLRCAIPSDLLKIHVIQ